MVGSVTQYQDARDNLDNSNSRRNGIVDSGQGCLRMSKRNRMQMYYELKNSGRESEIDPLLEKEFGIPEEKKEEPKPKIKRKVMKDAKR